MGTSGLLRISNQHGKVLVCVYLHTDAYLSGWGHKIATALSTVLGQLAMSDERHDWDMTCIAFHVLCILRGPKTGKNGISPPYTGYLNGGCITIMPPSECTNEKLKHDIYTEYIYDVGQSSEPPAYLQRVDGIYISCMELTNTGDNGDGGYNCGHKTTAQMTPQDFGIYCSSHLGKELAMNVYAEAICAPRLFTTNVHGSCRVLDTWYIQFSDGDETYMILAIESLPDTAQAKARNEMHSYAYTRDHFHLQFDPNASYSSCMLQCLKDTCEMSDNEAETFFFNFLFEVKELQTPNLRMRLVDKVCASSSSVLRISSVPPQHFGLKLICSLTWTHGQVITAEHYEKGSEYQYIYIAEEINTGASKGSAAGAKKRPAAADSSATSRLRMRP